MADVPLDVLLLFRDDVHAKKHRKNDAFDFKRSRWEARLGSDPAVARVLEELDRAGEASVVDIRRSDVQRVASAAGDDFIGRRELFVAALMWGYGGQIGRYRYLDNVASLLEDAEPLDAVLAQASEALVAGDVGAAYESFLGRFGNSLKGIGPAFFTKLLYFMALPRVVRDVDPPLILDAQVARALSWLVGTFHLYVNLGTAGWGADSTGYVRYVSSMARWSRELRCEPEDLEYYLWSEARGFTSAKRASSQLFHAAAQRWEFVAPQ